MQTEMKAHPQAPDREKNTSGVDPKVDTIFGPSTDKEGIARALESWNKGLINFIFPPDLERSDLRYLIELKPVIIERLKAAGNHAADVIVSINSRVNELTGDEYQIEVFEPDVALWSKNGERITVGIRVCVDAGVPKEATAGVDGTMGRTLAGDDHLVWVPERNTFFIPPNPLTKKLVHTGRLETPDVLEWFIEHTGCGRRGQMIANIGKQEDISGPLDTVGSHLDALACEFQDVPEAIARQTLSRLKQEWQTVDTQSGVSRMLADDGQWIGIMVKIAQRQGYKGLKHHNPIAPILLYDKFDGNMFAGLDSLSALADDVVIQEGGFTITAMQRLIDSGTVFSLKHAVNDLREVVQLDELLGVKEGLFTFDQIQQGGWMAFMKSRGEVKSRLWDAYDSDDKIITPMVQKYLDIVTVQLGDSLKVLSKNGHAPISLETVQRRIVHQLFDALSYAWVNGTFIHGHKPGTHAEDHMASGDKGNLGITDHLTLGQGDITRPRSGETFTGRAVLLHSQPGNESTPIVDLMKSDTDRGLHESLTGEETDIVLMDLKERFKLWPYIVAGDIVPVVAIRSKADNGALSRIAKSVLEASGDILSLRAAGMLPDLVPAATSMGEIIQVPATAVLKCAVETGDDLRAFRAAVEKMADGFAYPELQSQLSR